VRSRLTPNGIFVIWVPVYCFARDVFMILRNFSDVFGHVRVWAEPGPTGILVFGSNADFDLRPELLLERLRARGLDRSEPQFSVSQLVAGMSSISEERIRSYVRSFPPLTDDRPYTEFPLAQFLAGAKLEETNEFISSALNPGSSSDGSIR
jgi:hypothetical protein